MTRKSSLLTLFHLFLILFLLSIGQKITASSAQQAPKAPVPDIKINGSDTALNLREGTPLNITVALDPGDYQGTQADWWLVMNSDLWGLWSYVLVNRWAEGLYVTTQHPLFELPPVSVWNAALPEGNYTFYFGVDLNPDGIVNVPLWYDYVDVVINPPEMGDYGDAPDGQSTGYPVTFGLVQHAPIGQFPTRISSNGAHTLDASKARLGHTISGEDGPEDPNDPDGVQNLPNSDLDDCISNLIILLTSIPPPAVLFVQISAPPNIPAGQYYINVLIDLNVDGKWGGTAAGGEPEWVVKNYPITMTPGMDDIVRLPEFAYSNGYVLPEMTWMRIALTSEPVTDDDWNGTGEFEAGEIEDHIIRLPEFENNKKPPLLVVTHQPPNPIPIAKAQKKQVTVTVTNIRNVAGGYGWNLTRQTGCVVLIPGNKKRGAGAAWIGAAPAANRHNFNFFRPDNCTGVSKWLFQAAPDPNATITDEGVIAGIGESYTEIEFTEAEVEGGNGTESPLPFPQGSSSGNESAPTWPFPTPSEPSGEPTIPTTPTTTPTEPTGSYEEPPQEGPTTEQPTTTVAILEVQPVDIAFQHVEGVDSCPHKIASITIRDTGNSNGFSWDLSGIEKTTYFFADQNSGTGNSTVTIYYNCEAPVPSDISAWFYLSAWSTSGTAQNSPTKINITGHIVQPGEAE